MPALLAYVILSETLRYYFRTFIITRKKPFGLTKTSLNSGEVLISSDFDSDILLNVY